MEKERIHEAFLAAQDVSRHEASKNFKDAIPSDNLTIEDIHSAEVVTIMNYVDSLVLNTLDNLLTD
jgi:hypothetical protein